MRYEEHTTERQRALAARQPPAANSSHLYLDDPGAAKRLGLKSTRRLKDLRSRGGGPKFVRIGNAVRYRSDWLDAWAEENAVASTSEELARRRA